MKKVKITVLRRTLQQDLAAEYGVKNIAPCPMLREGQVFFASYAKPDGMCDDPLKANYQHVFALAHLGKDTTELWYYKDWIRTPGVAICSCNDDLRPVFFKSKATDPNDSINYTPIS